MIRCVICRATEQHAKIRWHLTHREYVCDDCLDSVEDLDQAFEDAKEMEEFCREAKRLDCLVNLKRGL